MNVINATSQRLGDFFHIIDPHHVDLLPTQHNAEASTGIPSAVFHDNPGTRTLQIAMVRQHLADAPELIHDQNELGRTVLHEVAYHGTDWLLPILVSAGADLEAQDDHGHTPLMEAVIQAQATVVERLLNLGADPEFRTKEGYGAIDLAIDAEFQNDWIVRLLTGLPY